MIYITIMSAKFVLIQPCRFNNRLARLDIAFRKISLNGLLRLTNQSIASLYQIVLRICIDRLH